MSLSSGAPAGWLGESDGGKEEESRTGKMQSHGWSPNLLRRRRLHIVQPTNGFWFSRRHNFDQGTLLYSRTTHASGALRIGAGGSPEVFSWRCSQSAMFLTVWSSS